MLKHDSNMVEEIFEFCISGMAKNPLNHHLLSCPYLLDEDRRFIYDAQLIECLEEENYRSDHTNDYDQSLPPHDPHAGYNYQPPEQNASKESPKVNRDATSIHLSAQPSMHFALITLSKSC